MWVSLNWGTPVPSSRHPGVGPGSSSGAPCLRVPPDESLEKPAETHGFSSEKKHGTFWIIVHPDLFLVIPMIGFRISSEKWNILDADRASRHGTFWILIRRKTREHPNIPMQMAPGDVTNVSMDWVGYIDHGR